MPITSDEGSYLYDGFLISKGNLPFKDFFTRSPLFISEAAIFIKILGQKIGAGRLLSILSALLTGVIIYFIGVKLGNKKIGIMASAFYLVFPSAVFQTIYLHTQPSEILFLSLAILMLLTALEKENRLALGGSGAILALSFFVRRSALLFAVAIIIYLFLQKTNLKKRIENTSFFAAGFLIIFLVGVFILIAISDFQKIWLAIGPGLIFSLQKGASSIGTFSSEALVNKITGLNNVLREGLLLTFLLLVFLFFLVFKKSGLPKLRSRGYLFLGLLLIFPAIGYFLYSSFDPNYFAEFLLPLVLMDAAAAIIIYEKKKKVLMPLLIIAALMIIFSYHQGATSPHTGQYSWTAVLKAANYIKEKNSKDDEILTSALAIPFIANRGVPLNISHPTIYRYGRISDDDRNALVPSLSELQNYMEENKAKFVIIDQNFKNTFFKFHEVFEAYVRANYEQKKVIKPEENIPKLLTLEIWERKQ